MERRLKERQRVQQQLRMLAGESFVVRRNR